MKIEEKASKDGRPMGKPTARAVAASWSVVSRVWSALSGYVCSFGPGSKSAMLVVGACVAIAALGMFHFVNFSFDDAFISFRYAENLVHGAGWVFNRGERVEGFSNPLWTLFLTLPIALGIGEFELGLFAFSKLLGGLATLFTVGIVARTAGYLVCGQKQVRILAPLVVATSAPLLCWSVSGLETATVALFVTLAVHHEIVGWYHQKGSNEKASMLWLLAALSRPEPVFLFAVAFLWRVLARPPIRAANAEERRDADLVSTTVPAPKWSARARERLKSEFPAALVFALPYGALLIARRGYYGTWLPNTYYAKVSQDPGVISRGWSYLQFAFEQLHGGLLLSLCLLLITAARRWTAPALLLASLVGTQLLLVVREGGDWMPGLRFLVPIVPLCALLIQHAWQSITALRARALLPPERVPTWVAPTDWIASARRFAAAVEQATWSKPAGALLRGGARVLLLGACLWSAQGSFHTIVVRGLRSGFEEVKIDNFGHFDVARWMQAHVPSHALLALGEAGVIPYYTKMKVVDLFGLVDAHIARRPGRMHLKFDVAYVLQRDPDYVFLTGKRTTEGKFRFGQQHAYLLTRNRDFDSRYEVFHEFEAGVLLRRRAGVFESIPKTGS